MISNRSIGAPAIRWIATDRIHGKYGELMTTIWCVDDVLTGELLSKQQFDSLKSGRFLHGVIREIFFISANFICP
jgi:hypothetical protein